MENDQFIALPDLCNYYEMEMSFFSDLSEYGLIEMHIIEETHYLHKDHIVDLEKIIRLRDELDLNLEGIDTVFNLLQKIDHLNSELNLLKNRLSRFDNE